MLLLCHYLLVHEWILVGFYKYLCLGSSSERKSEVKLKRGPSPEEIDQFAGKPAKRMKPESIKVTKESLHQGIHINFSLFLPY